MDAANWPKRNAEASMTGWEKWSTENCSRELTNGIESVRENEAYKILCNSGNTNGSLNPGQKTGSSY